MPFSYTQKQQTRSRVNEECIYFYAVVESMFMAVSASASGAEVVFSPAPSALVLSVFPFFEGFALSSSLEGTKTTEEQLLAQNHQRLALSFHAHNSYRTYALRLLAPPALACGPQCLVGFTW
jgi:hypothetical protein